MDKPAAPDTKELRRHAKDMKRSASALERGTSELVENSDRRNVLAADRTLLAAERTYAAWVRTALAALASGVGATAVMRQVLPMQVAQLIGSVLVIFAGFCLVAAVWRELHGISRLKRSDMRPIPRALLVPINVLLLLVAIAALVGIWSA